MSSLPVLLAGGGAAWEASLVASWDRGMPGLALVRRCLDVADLLASASTGTARVAVVDADLRRFDRDAVGRLHDIGVVVGAVVGDEVAERRVRSLGVDVVIAADCGPEELARILRSAAAGGASAVPVPDEVTSILDDTSAARADTALHWSGRETDGRVVAVWGAVGSPGRTTVALNLAAELAALDAPVVLAEADTYGPCLAQLLGVLDEAPGLAAAARAANGGLLDVFRLQRLAPEVLPGLQLLSGPTRTERWVELRRSALDEVWRVSRRLAAWTVVDAGFCLEQDEALVYDTTAPQRNGAALSVLEVADIVVVVVAGDPVGLARAIRELPSLREAAPQAEIELVVNRVRPGVMGRDAERQARDALRRHTGIEVTSVLAEDPKVVDAAVRSGSALRESAPRSVTRQRIAALAADLAGVGSSTGRRRHVS